MRYQTSTPHSVSRPSRGDAAPDFVSLYRAGGEPGAGTPARRSGIGDEPVSAYAVTGEQVRERAFLGWCALIDAAKYLRRGSMWEAHGRLQEARHRIWVLWAAAAGALYPWHGLSHVLDHDPQRRRTGQRQCAGCGETPRPAPVGHGSLRNRRAVRPGGHLTRDCRKPFGRRRHAQ
jgi:hypothetical protein